MASGSKGMGGQPRATVEVRVHAELNDLLSPARRGRALEVAIGPGATAKDLVESLGVPHTEIDVVLVNGRSVGFAHRLVPGDRLAVYPWSYPVSEAVDADSIVRLGPTPLHPARFVLDVHLGRLARYLRLLGFDSWWRNDAEDADLVASSLGEGRILLTRDRGILKRAALTHAYYVHEHDPRRQVGEVLRRFDLFDAVRPFGRCLECNSPLEAVAKAEVEALLPPRTRRDYDDFRRCPGCRRVYWQGSHYDRLRALVDEFLAGRPSGPTGRPGGPEPAEAAPGGPPTT